MSLKILGGTFRNRLLKTPKGPQTRPSLGILRRAVFDILQSDVEGAEVLDLYAGSGAMGLEALSRGASHTTFVDKDRYAVSCIRENIDALGVVEQSEVLAMDVELALKKLSAAKRQFDLVILDPPYALASRTPLLATLLSYLETHQLLKPSARLFIEEGSPPTLQTSTLSFTTLHHLNSRTFSQSVLHQFVRL